MKILILIFLSMPVFAESFKIAGSHLEFKNQDGLLLKGCEKSCEALKVIQKHKKIDMAEVRKESRFANSTGSDVCDKVYKASSILGVAENQDRRAFCVFKDQSMVEMNSLSQYLIDKKIVSGP